MSDATKPLDWFNNFNHAIQQKLSAYMPMEDIQVVVEEARKLFAAESAVLRERAKRAEADRDELRGLVEHHQDTRCCFYEANGVGEGDCRNYGHACPYCAAKEWLRAHPAIPEGTPAATKESE